MINFYNIDCMDFMRDKPDKFYDLAIVDPPYGIGDFNQTKSRKIHKAIKWNDAIPEKLYFEELYRISKNRIIWGVNYYSRYVTDVGRIVHDKTGGGRRVGLKELSDVDLASHSFGVNMKIFHYLWQGNVQGNTVNWNNTGDDARIHPCQKPIALYRWILQNYAKSGNKILDTHGGSMSIAIACDMEGYDLDICEIDKEYFDDGVKRFNEYKIQLKLF